MYLTRSPSGGVARQAVIEGKGKSTSSVCPPPSIESLVLISHYVTAVVCAKAVATGSVLCLVKGRAFVSSGLDQVQGHKASGLLRKLYASTAAMANREGGVAIRLALTGIDRTAVIQHRIKDFA